MLSPDFIRLTRCLHTGKPLCLAEAALLELLNRAVAEGRLHNRLGKPISRPLDAALVNSEGSFAYPVFDDIPVLLRDEAIDLCHFNQSAKEQDI